MTLCFNNSSISFYSRRPLYLPAVTACDPRLVNMSKDTGDSYRLEVKTKLIFWLDKEKNGCRKDADESENETLRLCSSEEKYDQMLRGSGSAILYRQQ